MIEPVLILVLKIFRKVGVMLGAICPARVSQFLMK